MKAAVEFLDCLGRVFDATGLAATAMEDVAFDALGQLLEQEYQPVFRFVDGDVFFANHRVPRLSDWKWTGELCRRAVERIEISQGVTREEFRGFLAVLTARLREATEGATEKAVPTPEIAFPHIRFGQLRAGEHLGGGEEGPDSPGWLQAEVEATGWLFGQAARGERVSRSLAGAVAQSLSVALHHQDNVQGLLVPLTEPDLYTEIHSVNTALLAMGLAETLGFSGADITAVGEAAILHDVGQTRVPHKIIRKPGKLSPEEWDVLKRHPADGARILIDSGPELELAAIVAYEHHIRYDGNGYPDVAYPHGLHRATQVFQVCDVYDALRTQRPFRNPWPAERILSYLREESGTGLYPDAVEAFTWMLAG